MADLFLKQNSIIFRAISECDINLFIVIYIIQANHDAMGKNQRFRCKA